MESPRGISSRPGWLLPLLVTSLVFGGAVGRPSGEPAVCSQSCCSVLPTCTTGWKVNCNCPGVEKMVLRKGDIPSTVRSVTIRHTDHVIVQENAIESLNFLVNLTLSDIRRLEIMPHAMARRNGTGRKATAPGLRSVIFEGISSLQIESHAFSGVWQSEPTVQMRNVDDLHVESNAFDYEVKETGPSVSLRHVQKLSLEANGFSAPMFQLALANVTMDECVEGSFGGISYITEWNHVSITEMRAKCFHGQNSFTSLDIRDSTVNNTHPGAFSGTADDVNIADSFFGTIHGKGFNMSVANIEITKCTIDDLQTEGLNIFTRESFWLDVTRINRLRKGGFLGIRVKQTHEDLAPMLNIRKLELIDSENGSLAFSSCTKVQITELDVVAPVPRICPTEKWTRVMSGGDTEGQLTQAQSQVFFQLLRRRLCEEDGWTRFPVTVELPKCQKLDQQTGGDADGKATQEDSKQEASSEEHFSEDHSSEETSKQEDDKLDASFWDEVRMADGGDSQQEEDVDYMSDWGDIISAAGSGCRGGACSAGSARSASSSSDSAVAPIPDENTDVIAKLSENSDNAEELDLRASDVPVVQIVVNMGSADVPLSERSPRLVASLSVHDAPRGFKQSRLMSSMMRVGGRNHRADGDTSKIMYISAKTPQPSAKASGRPEKVVEQRVPLGADDLSSASASDHALLSPPVTQLVTRPHVLLYVILGAVLMLVVVLISFLMVLMLRHREGRGHHQRTSETDDDLLIGASPDGLERGEVNYALLSDETRRYFPSPYAKNGTP